MPEPTFTQDDILEALRAACAAAPQDDGPGLSAGEIRQAMGWSKPRFTRELLRLKAAGRLRVRRTARESLDGALRSVPVYWVA